MKFLLCLTDVGQNNSKGRTEIEAKRNQGEEIKNVRKREGTLGPGKNSDLKIFSFLGRKSDWKIINQEQCSIQHNLHIP